MPTVLRQDGFSFRLYLNDHIPAHVHAFKAEGEAIIYIGDETEGPAVREINGMSSKEVKIATEHKEYLRQQWEKYLYPRPN